jgi:hypothetical protein
MNTTGYERYIEQVLRDERSEVRRRQLEASDARSGYESDHGRQHLRHEIRRSCDRELDARPVFFSTTAGRPKLLNGIGNTRQHATSGGRWSDAARSPQ